MSATLRIKTPEGITFSFQLAGPVVRCLAWIIDFLLVIAITRLVIFIASLAALVSMDFAGALMIMSYFVISLGYPIFTEWVWRGQTVGKRVYRLRVMDAHGLRLRFHQILLRNLLRPVDMLTGLYLVGGLACLFSRRAQRLGDLAANTIVIHDAKLTEPDLDQLLSGKFNSLRQHPHLEARLRQRVSAAEARLALQALVRRDELEPASRVTLFAELADHFKAAVAFPPEIIEAMPDEQYVRNVVDILFRTRGPEPKSTPREKAPAGV